MNKVKEYWGYLITFLLGLAGALAFFLKRKGRDPQEIIKDTKKQSGKIDEEIKVIEDKRENTKKDVDKIEQDLVENKKDRDSALEEHKNKTDQEIVDWWNR